VNAPSARPYTDLDDAHADPLARPLTFAQVMSRTGRSRRTITAWIADGLITPYLLREEHRTVRVFLERQVLEVHREMNGRVAAARLNLRNQRGKADAAQPDETVDEPQDAPDLWDMFNRLLEDCAQYPGLEVGVFKRPGSGGLLVPFGLEDGYGTVMGTEHRVGTSWEWDSHASEVRCENGSRISFRYVDTLLDAYCAAGSVELQLLCLDVALPRDAAAFLMTRLRAPQALAVPVLGVRFSDGREVTGSPLAAVPANPADTTTWKDVPPAAFRNWPAKLERVELDRAKPSGAPLTLRVRGQLDTSSLVASLRESAAAMNDAANRLEAVDGRELGAEPRPADG
jgi:hypothetical protein